MVSEKTNSTPNLIQCELYKSMSKTLRTLYPQGDIGWQSQASRQQCKLWFNPLFPNFFTFIYSICSLSEQVSFFSVNGGKTFITTTGLISPKFKLTMTTLGLARKHGLNLVGNRENVISHKQTESRRGRKKPCLANETEY